MILTMLLLVSTDMEVFSCACVAFAVSLLLAFCVLMSAVLLQVGQCARVVRVRVTLRRGAVRTGAPPIISHTRSPPSSQDDGSGFVDRDGLEEGRTGGLLGCVPPPRCLSPRPAVAPRADPSVRTPRPQGRRGR